MGMRSRHIFRLILQLQFEVAAHEHDFLADFFAWAFVVNRRGSRETGFLFSEFSEGAANHATIYALLPRLPSSLHLIILFKKVLTPRRACRFTVQLGLGFLCFFYFLVFGSGSGSHRKTDSPGQRLLACVAVAVEQGRQPWQQNVQKQNEKTTEEKHFATQFCVCRTSTSCRLAGIGIGLHLHPHPQPLGSKSLVVSAECI